MREGEDGGKRGVRNRNILKLKVVLKHPESRHLEEYQGEGFFFAACLQHPAKSNSFDPV